MTSILLRYWLRKKYVVKKYFWAIKQVLIKQNKKRLSIVNWIVFNYLKVVNFIRLPEFKSFIASQIKSITIYVKFDRRYLQFLLKVVKINKITKVQTQNRTLQRNSINTLNVVLRKKSIIFTNTLVIIAFTISFFNSIKQSTKLTTKNNAKFNIITKNKFFRMQRRINMYIEVYYSNIASHYITLYNINILIKKKKHRSWKYNVENINNINVEQTFIFKKNVNLILRLISIKTFKSFEFKLTIQVKRL